MMQKQTKTSYPCWNTCSPFHRKNGRVVHITPCQSAINSSLFAAFSQLPIHLSGEVTFPHGLVPKFLQPGPNLVPINKCGNIKTQPIHALPPSKGTVLHLGVCLGSKKSLLRRVFWLEANLSWSTWNHLSNLHDSMWWLVLNYSKQQFWG